MRALVRLPFAADLEALLRQRIARYASGRDQLSAAEVGEVAWGVSTLWEGFTGKRELAGMDYLARPELLHAYLLYYLPRSYVQARLVFRHLAGRSVTRMLDLGSGPGPVLRAAVDAFGRPGSKLDLVAVDHDARALKVAAEVVGSPIQAFVSRLPQLPSELKGRTFDLISLGLVVNELFAGQPDAVAKRADWLRAEVWPRLAPGGHLVIIEPALKETGRDALVLRDRLVASGLRVVAPCLRQGGCPALLKERDWCHAGLRYKPPAALEAIGRSVGIDPSDVRFTYLIFAGPSSESPTDVDAGAGEELRVVSDPMIEKGRLKLWVCGERGRVLLDRQDKHRTEANAGLDDLARDDRILVRGAEEKSESLRVVEATVVERVQSATEPAAARGGNELR